MANTTDPVILTVTTGATPLQGGQRVTIMSAPSRHREPAQSAALSRGGPAQIPRLARNRRDLPVIQILRSSSRSEPERGPPVDLERTSPHPPSLRGWKRLLAPSGAPTPSIAP